MAATFTVEMDVLILHSIIKPITERFDGIGKIEKDAYFALQITEDPNGEEPSSDRFNVWIL